MRGMMIAGLLATCGMLSTQALAQQSASPATKTAAQHKITWDRYSLQIDGERLVVWSGEMHPFRLPNPTLWKDILQKMKASGYNTVAFYFDWGYHSPKPGVYDFTGIRDMDLLLEQAAEAGLYVIARPGPYMNAEVTRGGFPTWLATLPGRARTDAPEYTAAADEWLTHMNAILSRHQLTDGGGTVIAYQIENELDLTSPSHQRYMQHLHDKVRADGITVPVFHNDKGRNGFWVPKESNVPLTVPGPVDIYAFDGYPGGGCTVDAKVGPLNPAPDWGLYSVGGAKGGASASPTTPGFAAEFGGGWFDYWGSNNGYPCTAERHGPGYQRVFYGTNIANGITLQSFYMTFGGTSWGWLPAHVVYTSYDYGAAIDEARRLRPKAGTMKQLGQFLQAVKPIARQDKATPVEPSSKAIRIYHNTNSDTGTHFYFAVHSPSTAVTTDSFTFAVNTTDGSYVVPREGTLQISGQDAKMLVAAYDLERQRLVYSTSEIQTHLRSGDADVALLYGRQDEDGETVLRYTSQPEVNVLSGAVSKTFDAKTGDLRLNYKHGSLMRVRITGGGRQPLLLLVGSEREAQKFWRQDTSAGPTLQLGAALVRTATVRGSTLALTGDTDSESNLEVWAPPAVRTISWNGATLSTVKTDSGSVRTARALPGPQTVQLPDLTKLTWRVQGESPEAQPGFDDSTWQVADKIRTNSPTKPPVGQPLLQMDDYGFHHGDVWYRGRYTDNGSSNLLTLHYGGGGAGLLQVWLDGQYLGQHELAVGMARPPTTGVATFEVPQALRSGSREHVLAVMVRNNSHNWDLEADDAHKEARGLISASLGTRTGPMFAVPIKWRLQGSQGGENIPDTLRGVMNNGGLFGERNGWHLPEFADKGWSQTRVPDQRSVPGTTWYRTEFSLDIPKGHDASLGLTFGDANALRSAGRYRVLIFLNGWNMGQFIAHIGPQRTFVLPNGILNPYGRNTLALAVTSDGQPGDALEPVQLTHFTTVRGGLPLTTAAAASRKH